MDLEEEIYILGLQGELEMEIAQLDPDERIEFLEHLGIDEPVKNRFLRTIYAELNLVSFLTAGEDEVRAWSIRRDTPAMRAAGKILRPGAEAR